MVYHVRMPQTRLVTAEELLAMGEGRRELIYGVVVEMTASGADHSRIAGSFVRELGNFVVPAGLGQVYGADGGFRLARKPDLVRVPDAAFVSSARLTGMNTRGFLPFAPDLAVEVISPNDSRREVEEKAAMWLRHGSRRVWVADPDEKTVTVHRIDGSRTTLGPTDTLSGEDVLPGFELPVTTVF